VTLASIPLLAGSGPAVSAYFAGGVGAAKSLARLGGGPAGSYTRSSVFLKEKTQLRLLPGETFDRCIQLVPNATFETYRLYSATSVFRGNPEDICSQ
jgi:hypothetical protein